MGIEWGIAIDCGYALWTINLTFPVLLTQHSHGPYSNAYINKI